MRNPFRRQQQNVVENFDTEAAGVTEVDRLFKMLYNKGQAHGSQIFLIASAMPGEGKSRLSAMLGLVAAHAGRRTLIVDADMRRPTQHGLFQIPRSPGLTDCLMGDVTLSEATSDIGIGGLKVMPCGSRVSSPGSLLQTNMDDFRLLLDECRPSYDVVLIDTPPIIHVRDTEVMGPLVDGVLLVVMAGKTYREIVQRAIELLERSNCNLLGITLNNVGGALPYYYDRKYYRDYYHEKNPKA